MRLRFQSHNYVYEVLSEIDYKSSVGKQWRYQKTYYGSSVPLNELRLLNTARRNILAKLKMSSGSLVGLRIGTVYA